MTKKYLRRRLYYVLAYLILILLTGVLLRLFDITDDLFLYATFKDLIALLLALPVALMSSWFQRRTSYLQSLRALWSNLIKAVNDAVKYTWDESPDAEKYKNTLVSLRMVMEDMESFYKDIQDRPGESGSNEPYLLIQRIYNEIKTLGFRDSEQKRREEAERNIIGHWTVIRAALVSEFDRGKQRRLQQPQRREKQPVAAST